MVLVIRHFYHLPTYHHTKILCVFCVHLRPPLFSAQRWTQMPNAPGGRSRRCRWANCPGRPNKAPHAPVWPCLSARRPPARRR